MNANEPGQPAIAAQPSVTTDLDLPAVALAVGAHPDDVEFGAGGTLAKWAAAGCTIHHLICTDGSKGTWDPAADTAALVLRRQREQADAARALAGENAGEVVFLGYIDGELPTTAEAVSRVARVIRELRPDVVLGHDPWKRYRLHPDHRAAGILLCDGVVGARDPHFFPDHGLAHHRPDAMLLWEADEVNHVEDVSAAVGAKLAALESHESQFETTMGARGLDDLGPFRDKIRQRLADIGEPYGFAAAEAFHLIDSL